MVLNRVMRPQPVGITHTRGPDSLRWARFSQRSCSYGAPGSMRRECQLRARVGWRLLPSVPHRGREVAAPAPCVRVAARRSCFALEHPQRRRRLLYCPSLGSSPPFLAGPPRVLLSSCWSSSQLAGLRWHGVGGAAISFFSPPPRHCSGCRRGGGARSSSLLLCSAIPVVCEEAEGLPCRS